METLNNCLDVEKWFTNIVADYLKRPDGSLSYEASNKRIRRIIHCIVKSDPEVFVFLKGGTPLQEAMSRQFITDSRKSISEKEWECLGRKLPKIFEPFLLLEIEEAVERAYIRGKTQSPDSGYDSK